MEPTGSLTVTVTGAREAAASHTWGQWSIWHWHGMPDEEVQFNNPDRYPLPVGCSLPAVADAVGYVLHRHDALRTVFRTEDGTLRQVVQGAGALTVDVFETTAPEADTVAGTVATRLAAMTWNGQQWPVRLAVVVADGSPAFLVMGYNRLVIDATSADIVRNEVMKACTGEASELPVHWPPERQARYECSPEGSAANASALEHWRRVLLAAPPSMFDYPARVPERMRFGYVYFESPAMARAVWMMRKRWRMTSASLLVSAMAVVVGRYVGHREVVMQLLAANRGDRNRRQMVGTLTALGLLHVDLSGLSFEEIAHATFRAVAAANQSAFCDPRDVLAVREELRLRRGAYLDLGLYFNDLRSGWDIGDEEPEMTEPELRGLARTAWATRDTGSGQEPRQLLGPVWGHEMETSPTRADARFFLITTHGRHLPLMLFGDSKYFSRDSLRELLCGMERLLVTAACGEVGAAELDAVTGVTPVSRGGSWVRCGGGWTDLGATARLWRQVTGTDDAAVCPEESPDRTRELVGYLAGTTPPSFAGLHRAFVAALGDRNDVRAPDRYRWVAAAPAHPAAWHEVPVLFETDGRPAGRGGQPG